MESILRWPALAAVAFLFAGAASARDIVVGQVVDYAGKHGEASRDYVAGARTYFDSINAHGGVNGNRVVHVVLDGGRDAASVQARTRELLVDRRADVLFGYAGEDAVDAALKEPVFQAARAALVAPLAGRPAGGTAAGVFYARPGYEAEVRQAIEHFRALQVTRFAVVRSYSPADAWVADAITHTLAQHRMPAAGVHVLSNDSGGTERDVDAVLALKAQALIIAVDTVAAAEFVKRLRPRDPGTMIIGLSLMNHRVMFEMLGPQLAHGVMIMQVVPNPGMADSAAAREHLAAMRTFRDEPPSHLTLEGFLAAKALVEGLRRAGNPPTRESIAAAFHKAQRIDVGGVAVDFTPAGRLSSPYVDIAMIRRNGSLLQ